MLPGCGQLVGENKIGSSWQNHWLPHSENSERLFKYMEEHENFKDIRKYHYHVLLLVKKLEQANFLCNAGNDTGFTMAEKNVITILKNLLIYRREIFYGLGKVSSGLKMNSQLETLDSFHR